MSGSMFGIPSKKIQKIDEATHTLSAPKSRLLESTEVPWILTCAEHEDSKQSPAKKDLA